jgi:hypothetical protein
MPSSNPEAETTETRVKVNLNPIAQAIMNQSWWDIGDAILYVGTIHGEVSPKEEVVERIAKLQKGYTSATRWKLVIDNYDQQDLLCLPRIKFPISNSNVDMYILPQGAHLKIYLLRHGWSVAKTHMTVLIYRWSGTYQKQRNCCMLALVPNVHSKDGKKTSLPPLLDQNPDLAKCIIQYAKQNLHKL